MTVNKSWGETLEIGSMHLEHQDFSDSQLYVGSSGVGKPSLLFSHTTKNGRTKYIAYQKVL